MEKNPKTADDIDRHTFSKRIPLLIQQRYQRSNNCSYNVSLRLTNSKVFILFIFKEMEPDETKPEKKLKYSQKRINQQNVSFRNIEYIEFDH